MHLNWENDIFKRLFDQNKNGGRSIFGFVVAVIVE